MLIAMNRVSTFFRESSPAVVRILAHSLLFGLAASVSDVLFNFYLHSLGYGNEVAGQMNSLFRIAGFVFGIPLGMLIDRRGALRILYFGITTYAIGWAVLLTWTDIRIIAPVYFLIGAANIATYTSIVPLLSSVIEPKQRATLFGINAGATVAVGFVGSLFGGALPGLVAPLLGVGATDSLAYRVALFSVTIIGLIAIVPLLGVHAAVAKQQSDGRMPVSTADQTPIPFLRIMGFASQSLLLGVAGGLVVPFQNLFYRQQFHLDDAKVGLILALSAFAMGFGSTIGGAMAKRFGLRRAAALSRLLSAPTLLLMLVPSLWVSCLAYFLSRIMVGITFPLADALVMQSVPVKQRGTSMSLSSMLWSLGWAGTAYLSGFIQRDYGFYWVFIASAVAYSVNAGMFYLIPFKDEGH